MISTFWFRRYVMGLAVAGAAAAVPAESVMAQAGSGPGWSAWLGCWQPAVIGDGVPIIAQESVVLCFLPAEGDSRVELVTVEGATIVERQILDASGARLPAERDGCSGFQSTEWAADGRRVYQRSAFNCPGALQRHSSGIFAIGPGSEWVAVEAVTVGEAADVRVISYRPTTEPERRIPEIAQGLSGRGMAVETARVDAAARLDLGAVVEATNRVDIPAVEAWLIEYGQGFELDRERLIELANAGVHERVIDLIVALTYPRVFAIDRSTRQGELIPGERLPSARRPGLDPWSYPGYYPGYYSGYYRGGFYPGYGVGWYGRPVIVRRSSSGGTADSGGKLVNGRGYTRTRTGSDSPSVPRSSAGQSGSSRSSGTASTGASGSPGGSGSSSGRTAKPRQ